MNEKGEIQKRSTKEGQKGVKQGLTLQWTWLPCNLSSSSFDGFSCLVDVLPVKDKAEMH